MSYDKFTLISEKKIFNINTAKHFLLNSNDLNIILLKNTLAPIINFQIWYNVGSSDEIGNIKTGQAHFLEHMMFRGTQKYPQGVFDTLLDEAGGTGSNAFTSLEYTAYTVSLPKDKLELIMELESDRMVNLQINQETITPERGAILNERSLRVDDDPNGYMWEILVNNIYKGTPYEHDIIGYRKDIENISVEDCKNFYDKFYAPNNASIVITGDFEEEKVLKMIYKYFSPIEKTDIEEKKIYKFKIKPKNKVIKKEFDIMFDKFIVGYQTTDFKSDDFLIIDLLSIMLTDTRTAFFKKQYVDTDLLTGISSYTLNTKSPSILTFEGSLKKISPDDFLDDFDKKLSIFIKNFTDEDLEIAKNKFITDFTVSFSSNYKASGNMGESISLTKNPFFTYELIDKIKNITSKDIKEVFYKYLNLENRLTVLLLKR